MDPSTQPKADEAIIRLYFARDERAIAETERRYGRACLALSEGIVRNRSDAEECVSDAYIKTWDTIPPTHPRSLRAYLFCIVRRLSINRLRNGHQNRTMTVSLSELSECIPATTPDPAAEELPRLLSSFVRELEEADRRLFMGRYWYARPVKELAREGGMSPNAASVRLFRIREALRTYLTEGGYSL